MSYIEDYIYYGWLDNEEQITELEELKILNSYDKLREVEYWMKKDGDVLLIKNISDNHLKNIYKILHKLDIGEYNKRLIEKEMEYRNFK